jgi:Na+-transporting NADH:ubiquinone oxidoreductase subunit C
MNKNSNLYIFIYAAVMVIIVAFVLAFVSDTLAPTQQKNVDNDKRKQILFALNIKSENPEADFAKYQIQDIIVNQEGEQIADKGGFVVSTEDMKTGAKLPVYVANVEGETVYVLPMHGAGVWGPIWGYVGVKADKNTIIGVYFGHEGETPGLGAEITADKFKSEFPSRVLIDENGNALNVVKLGKAEVANNEVDGVSAATMTSVGVGNMFQDYIGKYKNFLNNK